MSYLSQTQLESDSAFQNRARAAITSQSVIFLDDTRADIKALAEALLRGDPEPTLTFTRMLAGAPGFAQTVDNGDGTISSDKIADDEILSAVQAEWPTVAALFYDSEGAPQP